MALIPVSSRGFFHVLCITLVGLLAVTALAGCGSEPEPATVASDATNSSQSASTLETQPGAAAPAPSGAGVPATG